MGKAKTRRIIAVLAIACVALAITAFAPLKAATASAEESAPAGNPSAIAKESATEKQIEKYIRTTKDTGDKSTDEKVTEDTAPKHDDTIADVHADLDTFDQAWTYDIMAFVPTDAAKVKITDTLVKAITFDGDATSVAVADMGTANDHKAGGTVSGKGTALKGGQFTSTEQDKTLTVEIPDAASLRGHWVRVTFGAKYDNSVVATWKDYSHSRERVTENGSVITDVETPHRGTPGTANYQVDSGNGYGDAVNSNTVTVTPGAIDIDVKKVWTDIDGNVIDWPGGTLVTVNLMDGDQAVEGQEIILTRHERSGTFKMLPKYTTSDYKVTEASVRGVGPEHYDKKVTGNVQDGFTITNNENHHSVTSISVSKKWVGGDESEHTATFHLYQNWIPYTGEGAVKTVTGDETVTWQDLPPREESGGLAIYTVVEDPIPGYVSDQPPLGAESGSTITNTKIEAEKYVNKDVHADLEYWDGAATYDIMGFVMPGSSKVTVADTLAKGLEFVKNADDQVDISVVDMGTENNHKAGGTVSEKGSDIASATDPQGNPTNVVAKSTDGQNLQVAIDNIDDTLRGHWVKVTFRAKINEQVIRNWQDYRSPANLTQVDDNGLIISDTASHEGIANVANWTVETADGSTYGWPTNTVTVTPKETELLVKKAWLNADGTSASGWPTHQDGSDIMAEFRLVKLVKSINDEGREIVTRVDAGVYPQVVSSEFPFIKWIHLPVHENVEYAPEEKPFTTTDKDGKSVTYFPEIKKNDDGTFTGTNGPERAEAEVYVNSRVDENIVNFDQEFAYSIMVYVPSDATSGLTITDTLEDVLEFADGDGAATTDAAASVQRVSWKSANNHYIDGLVVAPGVAINPGEDAGQYTASIDGQTLTVTIADPTAYRGGWAQVTFNARIADMQRDLAKLQSGDSWGSVITDGTVLGANTSKEAPHEGIVNKGSYEVTGAESNVYKGETNTVTIHPETEDLEITKVWVGDDANARPAADDTPNAQGKAKFRDSLKLAQASDGSATDVTATFSDKLTVTDNGDNTYTAKWTGLPKLKSVVYGATEDPIAGYSAVVDGNTITNTKKPVVVVSKVDAETGKELPGAQLELTGPNGYKLTWTSGDAPRVLEDLQDGTYTLTEIAAPEGYGIADPVTFTVKNGEVAGGKVVMKDSKKSDGKDDGKKDVDPSDDKGGNGGNGTEANGGAGNSTASGTVSAPSVVKNATSTEAASAAPTGSTAQTGDDAWVFALGAAAIAALAGGAGVFALRRRES